MQSYRFDFAIAASFLAVSAFDTGFVLEGNVLALPPVSVGGELRAQHGCAGGGVEAFVILFAAEVDAALNFVYVTDVERSAGAGDFDLACDGVFIFGWDFMEVA
jgi:hypothetical protein